MDNADTVIIAARLRTLADQVSLIAAGLASLAENRRGQALHAAAKEWRYEMTCIMDDAEDAADAELDASFGEAFEESESPAATRCDAAAKLAADAEANGYDAIADGIRAVAEAHFRR